MIKINRIAMIACAIFVFAGIANACTVSDPAFQVLGVTWGNSTLHFEAGPGSNYAPLTVTMGYYGGTCNLYNVKGFIQLSPPFTSFNGSSYVTYYIPEVAANSTFSLTFRLDISNSTSAGQNLTFSYPLYVYWNQTSSFRNSQEYNIDVPLKGSVELQFNTFNRSIDGEGFDNISVMIVNKGTGIAHNISMELGQVQGVSIASQPTTVKELLPGAAANVSFSAYISQIGGGTVLQIPSNVTYYDAYGYEQRSSQELGFYTGYGSGYPVTISLNPGSIYAEVPETVNIVVQNNGDAKINNVYAEIVGSSSVSVLSPNEWASMGTVAPHSSANLQASIFSTSTTGVSPLQLMLEYSIGGKVQSLNKTYNLLTPGLIELEQVSSSVIPARPTAGGIFSVTATLDNVGPSTAYSVKATPELSDGIRNLGANSTFIGNVQADTPTSFTLSFLAPSKEGAYSIPVVLSYLNNLDNISQQIVYFNFTVASSGNAISGAGPVAIAGSTGAAAYGYRKSGGGLGIVVIVVIIIIAAAALLIWKARKKKGRRGK